MNRRTQAKSQSGSPVVADGTTDDRSGEAPEKPAELFELRDSIDNIDAALIYLLAERFKCTKRVGVLKAEHRLPPVDPAREAAQIRRLRPLAESANLDPDIAEKFLDFLVTEVIHHHKAIADSRRNNGPRARRIVARHAR
ncbi:chorismate mutase [Embleya sp. NPDC059237]|uniref:chorismate mutase n=1 Tax=Embleya sp. NPDC059237 TaxID=3346784 RepID=UPI0036AE32D3